MNHSEFLEISQLKWGPVQYRLWGVLDDRDKDYVGQYVISMVGHKFPVSIRESEFEFLKNFIIKYDLKNGFELATAFGISAIALGLGFKQTGGHLLTMDCYVEEHHDSNLYDVYGVPYHYENTDGWKSANYLIEHFRLKKNVTPKYGWSPGDTGSVISQVLTKKIDFIFLDAGHYTKQIMMDLGALKPWLADEYVIILHDFYPHIFTEELLQFLEDNFGKKPEVVLEYPKGENMALIINKKI
jgi:predicted O-methyltransferase YrrM